MDLEKILSELKALERDKALEEETNLASRAKALEFIAFVNEIVRVRSRLEGLKALKQQADSLRNRLKAVDECLVKRLRTDIQEGRYTRESLRRELDQYTSYSPEKQGRSHIGYDGLDKLLSGMLEVDPLPRPTKERLPEMVHYEPTPARAVLDLIDSVDLKPDDVFYDLGSGLGQVVILVNLLTGIKTKGVEFEPAFHHHAQKIVRKLGLTNIELINADARDVDYSDGTIFFMFTPFKGAMLQTVLDKLRHEAQKRMITVCTYGPCTRHVFNQSWLKSTDSDANHDFKLAVFHSKGGGSC